MRRLPGQARSTARPDAARAHRLRLESQRRRALRSNPSTAVICQPLLGESECEELLDAVAGARWLDARIAVPAAAAAVERTIRSGSIAELDAALPARALSFVDELNRACYGFELTGPSPQDPVVAMRYLPGDHFDWHIDNATEGAATRKLSFTLQLSDPQGYDGGDLELALYARPQGGAPADPAYAAAVRRRGAITVFPSFHLHRVSPVTRGTRVALVGWLHGPRFR